MRMIHLLIIGLLLIPIAIAQTKLYDTVPKFNITKTGAETYINVKIKNITDTSARICLNNTNSKEYEKELQKYPLLQATSSEVPITKLGVISDYTIQKTQLDLSKENQEECFYLTFEPDYQNIKFKIGTQSIQIESISVDKALSIIGKSIVQNSTNGVIVAYKGGSDPYIAYANPDNYWSSWTVQTAHTNNVDNTYPGVALTIGNNEMLYVYYQDTSDHFYITNMTTNSTYSTYYDHDASIQYYGHDCEYDGSSILCSYIRYRTLYLSINDTYNSTIYSGADLETVYSSNIEVNSSGCRFVIKSAGTEGNIDILSECDNKWSAATAFDITGDMGQMASQQQYKYEIITIDGVEHHIIFGSNDTSSRAYIWNSTQGSLFTKWDGHIVSDDSQLYYKDMAIADDGRILLITSSSLSDSWMDTYNGTINDLDTWTKTDNFVYGQDPSIAHQKYPETARFGYHSDIAHIVYEQNNDIWYINKTIEKIDPPQIEFVSPTPINNTEYPENVYNVTINFTVDDAYIDTINYEWDGTNYTLYDETLYAYYGMDEGSLIDYINDISLVNYNGYEVVDGVYTDGLSLDGINQYFTIDTIGTLDDMTTEVTIACWIRVDGLSSSGSAITACGVTRGNTGAGGYKIYYDQGDDLRFIAGSTDIEIPYTFTYGDWIHVAGTYKKGVEGAFYINGKSVGTDDATNSITYSVPKLYLGYLATRYMNGTFDEVVIYNKSLSADEINTLYNSKIWKFSKRKYGFEVNQTLNSTHPLANGTYVYKAHSIDTYGESNDIQRTITIGAAEEPGDTCTYTSGDWEITCSDNCIVSEVTNVDGNIILEGTGIFSIEANLSYKNITQAYGCNISQLNGVSKIIEKS